MLRNASNELLKDSVIKLSRDYIFDKIANEIFVYWFGTPSNFYGQTRIPRQGTIACGYFVTGVLSDAGFNFPKKNGHK